MGAGNYSLLYTATEGATITHGDRNAEHQNHINNHNFVALDDYSTNLAQMQAVTDPYPSSAESLATSGSGELERLRYVIKQITGEAQWYIDPDTDLATHYAATATHGATGAVVGTTNTQTLTNKTLDAATTVFPAGHVVQVAMTQTGAMATGTTVMPIDDTIPQNTEGDEYMTLAITPKSATNKLIIEAIVNCSPSIGVSIAAALFQDSTANALAAITYSQNAVSGRSILTITHTMTAGTTSATTFKVRVGPTAAATITFNGCAGAREMGGVSASSIVITEVQV